MTAEQEYKICKIMLNYEKSSMNKLLIKEQCAEYNITTGEFVIHNLLKEQ